MADNYRPICCRWEQCPSPTTSLDSLGLGGRDLEAETVVFIYWCGGGITTSLV